MRYLYVVCVEMTSRHAAFASNLDGSTDSSATEAVLGRCPPTRQPAMAGVLPRSSDARSIRGTDRHQLTSIVTRGHRLGRPGKTP